jgi:hypothetical protein
LNFFRFYALFTNVDDSHLISVPNLLLLCSNLKLPSINKFKKATVSEDFATFNLALATPDAPFTLRLHLALQLLLR